MPDPLTEAHQAADADFSPYAGTAIVETFGEPQAEYAAFHRAAALLDCPQRGVLRLTGKDRLPFLGNLLTANVTALTPGHATPSLLLNLKGRIVAELNVVETADATLVETEAHLLDMLADLFDRYLIVDDVTIERPDLRLFSVHGETAGEVLDQATDNDLPELAVGDAVDGRLVGKDATIFRHDTTGHPGLHLLVPTESALDVWEHLSAVGGSPDPARPQMKRLRPAGWAAFNACRIEGGRVLPGIDYALAAPSLPRVQTENAELGKGVLPAELPHFDQVVSVTKGCYLGQEVVARMYARKVVARRICGFRVEGEALPHAGAEVYDAGGEKQIGVVSSSTLSPVLSRASIGFTYLPKTHFDVGSELQIMAEGERRPARVVALPFHA
ncbi:MAG: glycine cleavage T C-terminal barrel domain-containing protein [Planctomycetota bacterium]